MIFAGQTQTRSSRAASDRIAPSKIILTSHVSILTHQYLHWIHQFKRHSVVVVLVQTCYKLIPGEWIPSRHSNRSDGGSVFSFNQLLTMTFVQFSSQIFAALAVFPMLVVMIWRIHSREKQGFRSVLHRVG